MSQETYTFACPVCAVRLSVPKALAGVRGPCPQCHHEITAPEPESVGAVALAAAPSVAAAPGMPTPRSAPPSLPPLPVTAPLPEPPARISRPPAAIVPPPLPRAESPAPPPRSPGLLPEKEASPTPSAGSLPPLPPLAAEAPAVPPAASAPAPQVPSIPPLPLPLEAVAVEAVAVEAVALEAAAIEAKPVADGDSAVAAARVVPVPREPVEARRRAVKRRSGWRVALVLVIGAGLVAAAVLNFLPRQSLREWVGRWVPSMSGEAVPSSSGAVADPENSQPSVDIEIRPALEPSVAVGPTDTLPAASAEPALDVPDAPGAEPALESTDSAPPPAAAANTTVPENPGSTDASGTPTGVAAPEPPSAPASNQNGAPATTAAERAPLSGQDAPPSLLPDISGGDATATAAPVDEALAGAQEALTLFLQARSWQDRLALSEGGESMKPEMEAHYATVPDGPNPPTSVEHIASAPIPGGSRTVQVFHVAFADLPQGFPVPVRQTDEGWKIDWRAFTEFREGRLKSFLTEYRDPPAVFRVRLQRAHVQDRAVPNLDTKYAFRIAAPIDGHEGYVFVDKEDSIVGPKIADKLDSNTIHLVMAKLKWVRGTNGKTFVELRDIVSNSWRESN